MSEITAARIARMRARAERRSKACDYCDGTGRVCVGHPTDTPHPTTLSANCRDTGPCTCRDVLDLIAALERANHLLASLGGLLGIPRNPPEPSELSAALMRLLVDKAALADVVKIVDDHRALVAKYAATGGDVG